MRTVALTGGGPPVSVDGEFSRVRELAPSPVPAPPIWTGSVGPVLLAVTGRLADGWIPGHAADWRSETVAAGRRIIDRAATEAGRDLAAVGTIYNRPGRITPAALPQTRDAAGRWIGGSVGQWVEELVTAVRTYGAGGFVVFPADEGDGGALVAGGRATGARADTGVMTDLIDLARELIAVRSTADRPGELRRALGLVLGVVGPGFAVELFESRGKPSALVYPAGPRPRFRVILNGHLDVVPGTDDQFRPRRERDRLYGRGAHDMKVAALVLATVFRETARELPYPIALQLVTDEEVGGYDGTAHQLQQGVTADFVVIGEQSGLRVVTESKGIGQVRLTATGVTAHAAYPWLGDNALGTLVTAVEAVRRRYPVPAAEEWVTTVNLARIVTGNQAVNQVPADATAWLDIRFPPGDEDFAGRTREQIAAHLGALAGVPVVVDSLGAPHFADPESAEVRALRAAARVAGFDGELLRKHGAADGRFYSERGIDAVIFGPGGDGQHGPAEYLDLRTVEPYRNALTDFLTGLTAAGGR